MELTPSWTRALRRAPGEEPSNRGQSPSMGEGGADLHLG